MTSRVLIHDAVDSGAIRLGVDGLPSGHGAVIYGFAPEEIERIELALVDGPNVHLPLVALDGGGSAFAVPIDNRLDPADLLFLRADGTTAAEFGLTELPPFLEPAAITNLEIQLG